MKLFKSIVNLVKAKESQISEAIEDKNAVEFAKQDLDGMEKDLEESIRNLGLIKSRIQSLSREMNEKKQERISREDTASKLIDAGKEKLAEEHCVICEQLDSEIETFKSSIKQQKDMLTVQEKNRNELKNAIMQAKSDMKMMKTMEDVRKSNDSLTAINVNSSKSALAKFQERRKKAQERLDVSTAIAEEQRNASGASLEEETAKVLGTGKGSALLAKLKEKK